MGVIEKYRKSPESIVSFNFTDIASGTGIVNFHCYDSSPSSGLDYHMSQNEFFSKNVETSELSTGGGSDTIDEDFDLSTFNKSIVLSGVGYFAGVGAVNPDTGKIATAAFFTITVQKWDGTTETDIVSVSGLSESSSGGGVAKRFYQLIPITIPRTSFMKGETLRLRVVWNVTWNSASGANRLTMAHDPQNRDGTYIVPSSQSDAPTTKMEFFAPFEIDP